MLVSPLFLFPYLSDDVMSVVLYWLTAFGCLWLVLSPSQLRGETLHQARGRALREIKRDPLFWLSCFLVVLNAVRYANCAIRLVYDAETTRWNLGGSVTFLPGGIPGSGTMPFAMSLMAVVLLAASRHSLGKAARVAFLFAASAFSGLAAIIACTLVVLKNDYALTFAGCSYDTPSFIGVVFGLFAIGGTMSYIAALERKTWRKLLPLSVFIIGGNVTGAIYFAPALPLGIFAVAEVFALILSVVLAGRSVGASSLFRGLTIFALGLLIPVLFIAGLPTGDLLTSRMAVFMGGSPFPDGYAATRDVLSRIAMKAWSGNEWLGTGLETFNLDIKFLASAADWKAISPMNAGAYSSWWHVLAERGIVGALMIVVPFGFLLWTYGRRLVWALGRHSFLPTCWLAPIALAATVATGFFDISFLRPDVLVVLGTYMAISASSMPQPRHSDGEDANGEKQVEG